MTRTLSRRGPDDEGYFIDERGGCGLGHRRLSIIDLAGGHQPIADAANKRRLCYNGEIYNYRALRQALLDRGHRFRTQTDGEVALHLYKEDATGFVDHLRGMFAIAILDEEANRLTLVRDRNGIKPLYYYHDERTLVFASEIKAILALLPSAPAMSRYALRQYLRWKYIPAPLTIFEGIRQLPAAHMLRATRDPQHGRIDLDVRCYWEADYAREKLADEREAVDQLDRTLRDAVTCHLESDVEVGALLSGGVDSSLVVALASTLSSRRIKTFSVGFKEAGFDQLPFARKLAEKYGTEHFEEYVDLEPLDVVPTLVRHFDEPFADSSALACYRVCQVASREVKVALTGDGGDETFAGYNRYDELLTALGRDNPVQRTVNRGLFALGATVFSPEAKFLRRYRSRSCPPLRQHEERQVMCSRWLTRRLLGGADEPGDGQNIFDDYRRIGVARQWGPVDVAQYVDSRMYLPGDILTKVDRTSMACSLECRVPLLDHCVTEFSAALPMELKIHNGVRKYLLKRVAERYVPKELLYRQKMGFRVPIRRWFKRGLLDRTAELLLNGTLVARSVLDPAGVKWILRNQRRPWMNFASHLWALLCLEYWARAHLDGSS